MWPSRVTQDCHGKQDKFVDLEIKSQAINYRLKSEVSIMLRCQLCYTAVRINNCSKSTSATKVYSHYEKYG